jgi:hypothetical protein
MEGWGMIVHTWNATQETKAEGSQIQGQPRQPVRLCLKQNKTKTCVSTKDPKYPKQS